MILDHQGNPLSSEKSFSNYNYDFSFMHSGFNVAGVDVSPLKAYQHGIVYSCIRVLAESIGQLTSTALQTHGERQRARSKPQNVIGINANAKRLHDLARAAGNDCYSSES